EVGSRQYRLGVSVGIAHAPDHAPTMEVLMQKADIAMYRAKQAGGDTYRFADSAGQGADTPEPAG
ncbi:MAG: diguanylate cyclase, partial [Sulfuritalea sp.]|nr:diguanylate cyclase [Sulfuritalea sp.]